MTNNLYNKTARIISGLFNPFLIPTIGLVIIMIYMPGIDYYSFKEKGILLLIVFLSTCLLPLAFIAIVSVSPGYNRAMNDHKDRIIPYFFTSISIFLGAQLLARLPFPSVFRLFLVGICLILVLLFSVTIWWKISGHAAAIGGLLGTLLALNFKYGMDFLWPIIAIILISGAIGSSQIYLKKHTPMQIYIGFTMSLMVMYAMIYFF